MSGIDPILYKFTHETKSDFAKSYRQVGDKLLHDMSAIREACLAQPDLPQKDQLAKAMIKINYEWDKNSIKTLKAFITTFKGEPFYADIVLSSIIKLMTNPVELGSLRYRIGEVKEVVLEFFDILKSLNPEALDSGKLHRILEMTCMSEWFDTEVRDKIASFITDKHVVNQESKHDHLTILQKLAKTPAGEFHKEASSVPKRCEFLLGFGADPNKHHVGTDPFIFSIVLNYSSASEFISSLINQHGLNREATDKEGRGVLSSWLSGNTAGQIPKALSLFKPEVDGENPIAGYLARSTLSMFRIQKDTHLNFIDTCLKAWENPRNDQLFALTQATLILIDRLSAIKGPLDIGKVNALLDHLRNQSCFEFAVTTLLSRLASSGKLDEVKGVLNAQKEAMRSAEISGMNAITLLKGFVAKGLYEEMGEILDLLNIAEMSLADVTNIADTCLKNKFYDIEKLFELKPELRKQASLFRSRILFDEAAVRFLLKNVTGDLNGHDLINKLINDAERFKDKITIIKLLLDSGRIDIGKEVDFLKVCDPDKREYLDLLVDYPVVPGVSQGPPLFRLLAQHDYDRAQKLLDRFGFDQFDGLYEAKIELFRDVFGISKEQLPKIIKMEIERVVNQKSGEPFDRDFVRYFSNAFQQLWGSVLTSEGKVDEAALKKALESFPYSESKLNFIPEQLKLYHQMQKMEKSKNFPSSEYWRYAIDARVQGRGSCAFEDEPGYLKGFFKGMTYALETRNEPKTAEWYERLQKTTVNGVLISEVRQNVFLDVDRYRVMQGGFRNNLVSYGVDRLDQDGIGLRDVMNRTGSSSFKFDHTKWEVAYSSPPDPNDTRQRAELKIGIMNEMLPRADTPAKRLFLYMSTARELEIEHVFGDANGRASHLALFSMVAGDEGLPMFLFPDPNVLDVNGPESLAYRYLEACVNFRNGGVGHTFERVKKVKELESLELHDADLIALRDELIPLVKGKSWDQAFKTIFP